MTDKKFFWTSIEENLSESKNILREITQKEHFEIGPVAIEGYARLKNPRDNMHYYVNVAVNLLEEIEEKIEKRKSDAHFTWAWGEFQKAISALAASYPHLKIDSGLRSNNKKNSKLLQRCWYALWYDYYMDYIDDADAIRKGRKTFDKYFETFLQKLREKELILDPIFDFPSLLDFIEKLASNPENRDNFVLPKTVRQKELHGKKLNIARDQAHELYYLFPPVGLEHYITPRLPPSD